MITVAENDMPPRSFHLTFGGHFRSSLYAFYVLFPAKLIASRHLFIYRQCNSTGKNGDINFPLI